MQSAERVLSDKIAEPDEGDESVENVQALPRAEDPPEFLPVADAAKALGVSQMTVRRLYDSRKLPGYRHGRTRQILRAFVDGFVTEIKAGQQPVLQDYADAWFQQAQEMAS